MEPDSRLYHTSHTLAISQKNSHLLKPSGEGVSLIHIKLILKKKNLFVQVRKLKCKEAK